MRQRLKKKSQDAEAKAKKEADEKAKKAAAKPNNEGSQETRRIEAC